jgi:hypothetical protein
MQLSQFRKGCVRKYISSAEVRTKLVTADPSTPSFDRPRRIADARGFDHARRDLNPLTAKTQEIPGREPIICGSLFDAAAHASATAANTTMRI